MKLVVCVVFVLASCEVSEDDEISDAALSAQGLGLGMRMNAGHLRAVCNTQGFFSEDLRDC